VAIAPRLSRRAVRERTIRRATLEELACSDYGALSFERVARRAGVNKTTLYRRYPTKADLVRSALAACGAPIPPSTSTGSLREDLLAISRQMVEFSASLEGQTVLRLLDHPSPDLTAVAALWHARTREALEPIIDSAALRGELRPEIDASLLLDLLTGALHLRAFFENDRVDEKSMARVVDLLLEGATPRNHQ
jgi:AcrR family transcriptional regulator